MSSVWRMGAQIISFEPNLEEQGLLHPLGIRDVGVSVESLSGIDPRPSDQSV